MRIGWMPGWIVNEKSFFPRVFCVILFLINHYEILEVNV